MALYAILASVVESIVESRADDDQALSGHDHDRFVAYQRCDAIAFLVMDRPMRSGGCKIGRDQTSRRRHCLTFATKLHDRQKSAGTLVASWLSYPSG
jgi:hypothetical protein